MSGRIRIGLAWTLAALTALTGCRPIQPFYLQEDGDLSHYLDQATDLEYPDVEQAVLPEAEQTRPPLTLSRFEEPEYWDLELEEAVAIALQNSKTIRNLGSVTPFGFADALSGRTAVSATVYDAAISEADVEAALSEFDALLSITGSGAGGQNGWYSRFDRPQNVTTLFPGFPTVVQEDTAGVRASITKRTANGTTLSISNQTEYSRGNTRGAFQALPSFWTTAFEVRADQPLLRGRGAQVNRIRSPSGNPGVLLARINTDITLAAFEGAVRNLVMDVENTYWDLYRAYREVEAARIGRDSALVTWRIVEAKYAGQIASAQEEAQAREQYFFFRSALETALRDLLNTENRLRWLMGLSPSDGRLIRPKDEPTVARVEFDWPSIHVEALGRSAELRQQRWAVKRAELELIYARNQVLPQLDVGALYRWVGLGDELVNADRNGANFPAVGSTAFDTLTEGKYQEFGFFLNFQLPVGLRSALAGVRRAQLQLAQAKARLEDMELNTSHLLTAAVRAVESNYLIAQTQFNRWKAASKEVESVVALYENDKATLDLVLDAQRRRAQAQVDYYRALTDYNKAIAEVHFRKGSLLEYDNVFLAEGPWTDKAYWDALERARERDASYYLDYGWTRPRVISRGPVDQGAAGEGGAVEVIEDGHPTPAEPIPTPPADQPSEPLEGGEAAPVTGVLEKPPVELEAPRTQRPLAAEFSIGAQAPGDEPEPAGGSSAVAPPGAAAPLNALRLASHDDGAAPLR